MPVNYIPESAQSERPHKTQKKLAYPNGMMEIFQGLISTVLKSRLIQIPSTSDLQDIFTKALQKNQLTKNEFCLFLNFSCVDIDGNESVVESWKLQYERLETSFISKPGLSKYYRSKEATLFYQNIYSYMRDLPLSKRISKQLDIKDHITWELTLQRAESLSRLSDSYEFPYLVYLKRHRTSFTCTYENQFIANNDSIEKIVLPIDIPKPKSESKGEIKAISARSCSPVPNCIPTETLKQHSLSKINIKRNGASGSLIGSYEESLIQGRMSQPASEPIDGFNAKITTMSRGRSTPHLSFNFSPIFYKHDEHCYSPYVGTLSFKTTSKQELKIPKYGRIQIALRNPSSTSIHLFLIPYDYRTMPKNHKSFLRYKTYLERSNGSSTTLIHAIQIHFITDDKGYLYLHREIKLIFTMREVEHGDSTISRFDYPPESLKFTPLINEEKEFVRTPDHSDLVLQKASREDSYLGYR